MRKFISLVLTISLLSQFLTVSVFSQNPPSTFHPQSSTLNPPPSTLNYNYDSSGNLTNDGVRDITYDASGMPASVTKGDTVVNFVYDGSGQRIGKIVKVDGKLQSSTIYFGSIEKEMAYNDVGQVTSTTITKYYFSGGKRIALRKNNDPPVFLHQDHLSSSTLFTDSSGGKKDALLTYFPYGNERPNWDLNPQLLITNYQLPTNHLYTDQIKDPETDLYYYNARYYNPQTGSFISADTAGDKLNKYAYANNNPVMFNDPTGHAPPIGWQRWLMGTPPSVERPEKSTISWQQSLKYQIVSNIPFADKLLSQEERESVEYQWASYYAGVNAKQSSFLALANPWSPSSELTAISSGDIAGAVEGTPILRPINLEAPVSETEVHLARYARHFKAIMGEDISGRIFMETDESFAARLAQARESKSFLVGGTTTKPIGEPPTMWVSPGAGDLGAHEKFHFTDFWRFWQAGEETTPLLTSLSEVRAYVETYRYVARVANQQYGSIEPVRDVLQTLSSAIQAAKAVAFKQAFEQFLKR